LGTHIVKVHSLEAMVDNCLCGTLYKWTGTVGDREPSHHHHWLLYRHRPWPASQCNSGHLQCTDSGRHHRELVSRFQ